MSRLVFLAMLLMTVSAAEAQHPLSSDELKAMFIKYPYPEYPVACRILHMTGGGRFRIHLDEQGRVTSVGIVKSTGHVCLDASAAKALLKWRAVPGPKRDVETPVTFVMSR